MNTLYLDVFSGISGDMFVGAMLDLGADFKELESQLQSLKVDGYHIHAKRGQKSGIDGVKFDVHLDDHGHGHDHPHEHDHDEHGHGHAHHHHEHEHTHEHHHHEHPHEHGHSHEHHHGRNFSEIRELIAKSAL